MKLAIYSLKKILYNGDAESINCRTKSGEITILNHHRPLLSALAPGIIKIIDTNKKEQYIPVSSGFLEVNSQNRTRCIVQE